MWVGVSPYCCLSIRSRSRTPRWRVVKSLDMVPASESRWMVVVENLSIPKLDTLRITASVSLAAFFAAVDLPRLCKLELDLGDEADREVADKTMYALFGSILIPGMRGVEVVDCCIWM